VRSLYNTEIKEKLGKHAENILLFKRKEKLICFDRECNLFKIVRCYILESYVHFIRELKMAQNSFQHLDFDASL